MADKKKKSNVNVVTEEIKPVENVEEKEEVKAEVPEISEFNNQSETPDNPEENPVGESAEKQEEEAVSGEVKAEEADAVDFAESLDIPLEDTPIDAIPELNTAKEEPKEDIVLEEPVSVTEEVPEEKQEEVKKEAADTVVAVKPEEKKDENKGPSKFSLFLKKHKIPVIIAAIVLIVAIAVTVTILIMNKDLVNISSAEDFKEKATEGKTTYVLKDDITVTGDLVIPHGMNIDLNKNSLTVSGKLSYGADAGDSEIFIGDKKGPLFLNNGSLTAGTIEVLSADAVITFYCPVKADGTFNVKTVVFENTVESANGFSITSAAYTTFKKSVTVSGADAAMTVTSNTISIMDVMVMSGENGTVSLTCGNLTANGVITAKTVSVINCLEGKLTKGIIGTLNVVNSSLLLDEESTYSIIVADNLSNLDIKGAVSLSLTGGLTVTLRSGSSCPLINGTITLNIYENVTVNDIIDVDDINFYTTLEAPKDITINQRGGAIILYIAEVYGADNYIVTIDSTELAPSPNNEVDITSYISEPGKHTVKVKAVSDNELLLDSPETTAEYNYNIKLATPVIQVNEAGGVYTLSFNQVPFATKYAYTINSGNPVNFTDILEGQTVSIDITEKITAAGVYVVKVTAYGENDEAYEPSEVAVTSIVKNIKLTSVSLSEEAIAVTRDGTNLLLDWDAVEYGEFYSVYVNDTLIAKTKNTQYGWTLGDLADNTQVKVIADGHGYYIASNASTATYNFETLEAPDLGDGPFVINGNVVLTWSAVPNAQSYIVYLDGQQVGDPITATSYTTTHVPAATGVYTVKAVAEYFREAVSDAVTVNAPALSAPVIDYTILEGTVTISFNAVPNATQYVLFMVSNPNDIEVDDTTETSFSFAYTDNAEYYVVAISQGYQAGTSNTISVEMD